jgi:tetratricopeptide (TPR) repeat protein
VAIDRELSLRRAEKLLRQGRLDGATEEYERLVEDQPEDWNTRNALGDLYVRAGHVEQAAAHFTRIADHFAKEGFFSRAIALYKKVVKIKPDDEHALLQSAEIAAKQGLIVDAKACLGAIAEQRRRRGDRAGANQVVMRIAALDPTDFGARVNAARAEAETGHPHAAAGRYKELAAELFARDRVREGVEALAEAVRLDPDDTAARDSLVHAHLQRAEISAARAHAATGAHFAEIAAALVASGQQAAACDTLGQALARDPSDGDLRIRFVRLLVARGDLDRAAEHLRPEQLADDRDLLFMSAEVQLRQGHLEAGREALQSLAAQTAGQCENFVLLGCSLVDVNVEAAFQCIDVAADAAVAQGDYPAAAAALQEFLKRVPRHVPALIRLVDVCVDGNLHEALRAAQCDLADCYLAAGRPAEARAIAEDLVLRSRGEPASVERFRKTLEMLGEPDVEAAVTRCLEDVSAACDLVEDLTLPPEGSAAAQEPDPVVAPAARAASAGARAAERSVPTPPGHREPVVPTGDLPRPPQDTGEKAPAVAPPLVGTASATHAKPDLALALGAPQPRTDPTAEQGGSQEAFDAVEIDLSEALTRLTNAAKPPVAPGPSGAPPAPPAPGVAAASETAPPSEQPVADLDDVFREFRAEVLREQATSSAAQQYNLALTYFDMGMLEESAKALQSAARSPQYRFQAASLLGRIEGERGRTQEAIEWFERAAETPAPNAHAARALLYELGKTLEEAGESSRALAVYLELQADVASYRDVASRIARLTQPHSGD